MYLATVPEPGAWALAAHWLDALRTRALWWFTGFAELAVFVQELSPPLAIVLKDLLKFPAA